MIELKLLIRCLIAVAQRLAWHHMVTHPKPRDHHRHIL